MNDMRQEDSTRVPSWRRALVAVLVVIGSILAPLSALSVWMKTALLNTDNYVATVAPLAHNADVQAALADRITNALMQNSAVDSVRQKIIDRLPKQAEFVAPKISESIASVVHEGALRLVQSAQFATLWKETNRHAHEKIVALLEARSSKFVDTNDGEITIDLGSIAQTVNEQLQSHGITAFSHTAASASDKELVLIDSTWLKRSQNATNLLQQLAFVLPVLTFLCFAVAIWLSPNRRRTVLRGALGVALGMSVLLIAMNGGRHFYLSALPEKVNTGAAGAVYDQLFNAFRLALRATFALALIIAIAAWVSGPGKTATSMREGVLHLVRGRGAAGGEASAFALWVARYKSVLRISIVGLALLILVFTSKATPAEVVAVALLVLLAILLIEFLSRRVPRTPTASVLHQ
jgi:hypothetical protein